MTHPRGGRSSPSATTITALVVAGVAVVLAGAGLVLLLGWVGTRSGPTADDIFSGSIALVSGLALGLGSTVLLVAAAVADAAAIAVWIVAFRRRADVTAATLSAAGIVAATGLLLVGAWIRLAAT